MNKTKLKVILGSLLVITVALLLRLKGNMDQKRNEKENIDNQRITAMTVKMIEPRVEKIMFSKSFFYSRIGTWHIRAHIVIDGKSYQEMLSKKEIVAGDRLPEADDRVQTKVPLLVIYSDGKEEILEDKP